MPSRQELLAEIKALEQRKKEFVLQTFDDERTPETKATFGGIVKQFTLGAVNSALLNFPKYLVDREGEGLFKASTSKGERFARGTGTVAGFLGGAPAKVLVKGGQVGAKLAAKAGLKEGTKRFGAVRGAVGLGGLDAVTAPEKNLSEKLITIPMATAVGGAFGLAEPIVAKAIKGSAEKLSNNVLLKKSPEAFVKIVNDMGSKINNLSNTADKAYVNLLKSKQFGKANKFVNTVYAGSKREIARTRVRLANMNRLKDNKKFREAMLSGEADKIANAQLKGIVSKRNIPLEVHEGLKNVVHHAKNNQFITSAGVYLSRQGKSARQLAKRGYLVRDVGERASAKYVADLRQATDGLKPSQWNKVRDILEGRIAMPKSGKIKQSAEDVKSIFDQIAKSAAGNAVGANKTQKIFNAKELIKDFKPRKDYFPRLMIDPNSKKEVINETLRSAIKRGDFQNMKEARRAWKEYKGLIENKPKGQEALIQHLINSKQARTRADAIDLLKRDGVFADISRHRRFGNLELSREKGGLQFPFYDPNAQRTAERYVHGAGNRLAEIRFFGRNDETLKRLVDQVGLEGGDSQTALQIMRRFTGVTQNQYAFAGSVSPEASGTIRAVQTIAKLGLAMIPNASQSINTAMVTGMKNTGKAIQSSLGKKTKQESAEFALRASTTLESSIRDYIKGLGLDGSFNILGKRFSATGFLEKTGFVWMERMNRTISANAGKNYAIQMGERLIQKPGDKLARRALRNMKINPEEVLRKGKTDMNDWLKAAQAVTNKTQFRSGPLDLPLFFTSPEGKILTQFKTFSFNQAKLIKDLYYDEVKKGNMRPLIVAVATMPIVGEGVKDVRGILSGQVRDEKGLERLIENVSAVGAAGMINDLWASAKYNNLEGAILGPTGGDIAHIGEGIHRAVEGRPKSLQRFALRNIPVVGPRLQNTFVPSNRLKKLREKRKREREKIKAGK